MQTRQDQETLLKKGEGAKQPCPVCGNPIGIIVGSKDAICPNCGYKDPCCEGC